MDLSPEGNQLGIVTRMDDDGVLVPLDGQYTVTVPVSVIGGKWAEFSPPASQRGFNVPLGGLVECGAVFAEPGEAPGALAEELIALRQTVELLRRAPVTAERLTVLLSEHVRVGLSGPDETLPFQPMVRGVPEAVEAIMALFSPPTSEQDRPSSPEG